MIFVCWCYVLRLGDYDVCDADIPTLPLLPGVSRKFMQSPGLPIFIKFSRFYRIFRKYRKKIINVLFLAT